MYHVLRGRRSFVDELYVIPSARRRSVARSLLAAVAGGAIELIVAKGNANAIALYTSLGFVRNERGVYEPNDDELCMSTTRVRRTSATLAALPLRRTRTYRWGALDEAERNAMIQGLRDAWGLSHSAAKRRLRPSDASIRYVLVA